MGRLIERASYADLIATAGLILAASTIYFTLAPHGHSLATSSGPLDASVPDALYFSIVTFTSLGYGDLSPQGFGRVVACIIVLCGLVSVALLVGKFASERQQALLRLIHTSDCQRRIDEFTAQLDNSTLKLAEAIEVLHCDGMLLASKDLAGQLEATTRYLIFNANQAGLMDFGNASTLRMLYRSLEKAQRTCIAAHKSPTANMIVAARTLAISARLSGLMNLMSQFHRNADSNLPYLKSMLLRMRRRFSAKQSPSDASPTNNEIIGIAFRMKHEANALDQWTRTTLTPARLDAIWQASPSGEPSTWPKSLNKMLAKDLSISNSLAQKCLDSLLACGRLPK
jgi:hypothetical protein